MLLGALNNIVLPDDCTSKGGKVRCKLVALEELLPQSWELEFTDLVAFSHTAAQPLC